MGEMDLAEVGHLHVESVMVRPSQVIKGLLLVADQRGMVRCFDTPQQVMKWIKDRDQKAASRGQSTATVVEWCDMPEDFAPPEA